MWTTLLWVLKRQILIYTKNVTFLNMAGLSQGPWPTCSRSFLGWSFHFQSSSSHRWQRERRCRQGWSRWCRRRRSPGSSCRALRGSTLSRSCCTRSRRPETGSVQLVFIGSSDKNIQFEQGQKHGRKISFTYLRDKPCFSHFYTFDILWTKLSPFSFANFFKPNCNVFLFIHQ